MQTTLQDGKLTIIKDSQRGKKKQFSSCCDSCHPIQRQGRFYIMTSSVDIFSAVKGEKNYKQAALREDYKKNNRKKESSDSFEERDQTEKEEREKRSRGGGEFIQTPVCDELTFKETSGVLLVALVWVYLSRGLSLFS